MRFLKNTALVLISNVVTIVSGIVVGFVLPMILSVNDYGYYKTFTLYVTYLGLFSFGFIDGIVLRYGGYDYDKLDVGRFRKYFRWYVTIQILCCVLICSTSLLLYDIHLKHIALCLGANLLFLNIIGYFRQISEITQRFKEYTTIKLVNSFLTVITILLLYLFRESIRIKSEAFVLITVVINSIVCCWYLVIYRKIAVGESLEIEVNGKEILELCKTGIPLMIANLCSTLILTLDRQFVNVLFDNKIYAIYAFAYNLLSLLTVATTAVSTVLYPYLKRSDENSMANNYEKYIVLLSAIVYLAISCYFPLHCIVERFLPQYENALPIFRVILPGLPMTSVITVIMHNYYKTTGKSTLYFKKSVIILALSFIANVVAYLIFKSPISMSVASIMTIAIWYIYVDSYFSSLYLYHGREVILYFILMSSSFYLLTALPNIVVSFISYLLIYSLISVLFLRSNISSLWSRNVKGKTL